MTCLHKAGRMMQFWGWIETLVMVNILFLMLYPGFNKGSNEYDEFIPLIVTTSVEVVFIGILTIVIGRYLKYQKLWSKISTLIISAISLFVFPIGTFFGAIIIMYLYRGWNDEPFKI